VSFTTETRGRVLVALATVHRAEPMHGAPRSASVDITEPLPPEPGRRRMTDAELRAFYRRDAEDVHAALVHALPGGTLDALFVVMAEHRASVLAVSYAAIADRIAGRDGARS
jgi:hypothetical protein